MRQHPFLARLCNACHGAVLVLLCAASATATDIVLPLELDLAIVEEALAVQLFTGTDAKAELFHDSQSCNALTLSEPRVEGTESGQLRVTSCIEARIGLLLGGAAACQSPGTDSLKPLKIFG